MASQGQITGMRGVFLVAAKLSELGFITSPTLRNAAGADLLVTDPQCQKAFSVQVKTNTSSSFFLIGKHVKETASASHIYVLVDIRAKGGETLVNFYVVPSKALAKNGYHEGRFPNIKISELNKYRNAWQHFGKSK